MPASQADYEAFVGWLFEQAIAQARGDTLQTLQVAPAGRFWLGRIAPQDKVAADRVRLGDRGERLEPCEVGIRVRPAVFDGRSVRCQIRLVVWRELPTAQGPNVDRWEKSERIDVFVDLPTPTGEGDPHSAGGRETADALRAIGADGLAAEVRAEVEPGKDGPELVITLVNVSPVEVPHLDSNLYEAELKVDVGATVPFLLEGLPDSFRYDRNVAAYGVNAGVRELSDGVFVTTDFAVHDSRRPVYWDAPVAGPIPDLSFERMSRDPIGPLVELGQKLDQWVGQMWSETELQGRARAEGWDETVMRFALTEAEKARQESLRVRRGIELLESDDVLRRAFMLANRASHEAVAIRHTTWRPFQLGFVLANLPALSEGSMAAEREIVDTLWFQTGGGKTETYLLFVLTAAFHDRLTGKGQGITSWARFPLRMLSLDQTQRFADIFAAAELVRIRERIDGDPFSVGFLVGEGGTPNRIRREPRPGEVGADDPDIPRKFRVLLRCPFCGSEDLEVRFDQTRWALDHRCNAAQCPWSGRPIPFRIVDEEIYRWLPTVVLGTLDKAASVAVQAAMRGFYGAPSGRCPRPDHGFTYSPRSSNPNGCLFPGCDARPVPLTQGADRFAPTVRMQDELHLLRDSLGSVDAHYEALLDYLQHHWGSSPKIIASSATLAGHDEQVQALYRRAGRTFPLPGPRATQSFWSRNTEDLARRYVGLAPRGVTLEYANDQLTETIQRLVRRGLDDPSGVAHDAGVPVDTIDELISTYGVNVVYGSTLKDVEAAARSFETQIPLDRLNPVTLTGRTPLEDVRSALRRLKNPEPDFYDRIHLIAASSMLSHGVDIDRLNVMVMLGLPLATAEFIQTTARVGRRYPGLVFVFHKIARERDAAVFRIFPSFVRNADRLIDPVPITSKSRRILELTFSGLEQGRIYGVHEPAAVARGLQPLTMVPRLRRAFAQMRVTETSELQALIEMLGITGTLDENLRRDLQEYVRQFFRALNDPAGNSRWPSDLFSTGPPMRSLRDVEEEVPVYSRGGVP